ncbi:putative serine carboxypeptidase-like 52 [Arachis hypogaea]
MVVPFLATQAWIRSLNYSIVDDWRPWYTNGQVAGYTRTYSNAMTFATVKGGGHTAPEYKLEECLHMSNYIEEFNGSLPNLVLRPHSWTKVQIIPIYLGIFFFHFTKSFESFPSYLLLY